MISAQIEADYILFFRGNSVTCLGMYTKRNGDFDKSTETISPAEAEEITKIINEYKFNNQQENGRIKT